MDNFRNCHNFIRPKKLAIVVQATTIYYSQYPEATIYYFQFDIIFLDKGKHYYFILIIIIKITK